MKIKKINWKKHPFFIPASVILLISWFIYEALLSYPLKLKNKEPFIVKPDDGFIQISNNLHKQGFITNPVLFEAYVLFNSTFSKLKAGEYEFSSPTNIKEIAYELFDGQDNFTSVPEGFNIYQLETKLHKKHILNPNDSILKYTIGDFQNNGFTFLNGLDPKKTLEGFLFPDSYVFLRGTPSKEILITMLDNFNAKVYTKYFLQTNPKDFYDTLILASILEKEILDKPERQLGADVFLKRLDAKMRLQTDASLCYIRYLNAQSDTSCSPVAPLKWSTSKYNVYKYNGLPPTPICNPSTESLFAFVHPTPNKYYYYIADPKTGKTIFAETLKEHNSNIQKYLR